MKLYYHLFKDSWKAANKLDWITCTESPDRILQLQDLGKLLHSAVLLAALEIPSNNPGYKKLVEIPCKFVHKIGDNKVNEWLKEDNYFGKHGKDGGYLISKSKELVDKIAPNFTLNVFDKEIFRKHGYAFNYPDCCIKTNVEKNVHKDPNITEFRFLHEHRMCSEDCEESLKMMRGRIIHLKEYFPQLLKLVVKISNYFSEGIQIQEDAKRFERLPDKVQDMFMYFQKYSDDSEFLISDYHPAPEYHIFKSHKKEWDIILNFA